MPISKTSGIKTGELRLFEVQILEIPDILEIQRLKIKSCYKIVFNFYRARLFFWAKIHKKI